MAEGGSWAARKFNFKKHKWETREVTAGDRLLEMLGALSEEPGRTFGMGRARGTEKWNMRVAGDGTVTAETGAPAWQAGFTRALQRINLEEEYSKWFDCPRGKLDHKHVACFNIWDDAPSEGTGGHRTIRGGPVREADGRGGVEWCLTAAAPLGTSVELYSTPESCRARTPGPAGTCTLGKTAFFVQHRSNDGANVLWAAVAQYVTIGRGQAREDDAATGHAAMRLNQSLSLFPVKAIRKVAHMYHRCTSACKATKENGGPSILRHNLSTSALASEVFLYNEHFHITGT